MTDPTDLLDDLAERARAEPVGGLPARGVLESGVRRRRRRTTAAKAGMAAAVLVFAGVSWAALRDPSTDQTIATTPDPTPTAEVGPTVEPTATPASASATPVATLAELPELGLTTIDGDTFDLRSYVGRPTVITVFATWCGPCEATLEALADAHQRSGGRAAFVAVSSRESAETDAARFAARAGVRFRVLLGDDGRLPELLDGAGLPITVVVDGSGSIVHRTIGALSSDEILEALASLGPSPEEVDAAGLAAMAADGLTFDPQLIPSGYRYSHVSGGGDWVEHRFVDPADRRHAVTITRSREVPIEPDDPEMVPTEVVELSGRTFTVTTHDSRPRSVSALEDGSDADLQVAVSGPARDSAVEILASVSYDPSTDVDEGLLPTAGRATATLEGLTLGEAQLIAIAEGWELRVTDLDGEGLTGTDDEVPNRVDLIVADGLIVGATTSPPAASTNSEPVSTADELAGLSALGALTRSAETLDQTGPRPSVEQFFAEAGPGNVAVRGSFVGAEQQLREWTAVRFVVTDLIAGDPDAAAPGDEIMVMVLTGGDIAPGVVGEQLARIDDVVLFLYKAEDLFPELPGVFTIQSGLFLGIVDGTDNVRFPFAERAGWPPDPIPVDDIG